MTAFKLILFDLDDTLFDFSACWERAMRATISSHNLTREFDTDAFYQALKRHSDDLWPLILQNKATFDEYRQLRMVYALREFNRDIEPSDADDFQKAFSVNSMEAIEPSPEATAVLEELADHYRLGIVTNGPADMAFTKVERLGLTHLFPEDVVFVSELVGYHKPDRRIFAHALQQLDVSAEETLFVGDTWTADVAGPIDAGISAVWLNRRKQQPATQHAPLAAIEKLEELRLFLLSSCREEDQLSKKTVMPNHDLL